MVLGGFTPHKTYKVGFLCSTQRSNGCNPTMIASLAPGFDTHNKRGPLAEYSIDFNEGRIKYLCLLENLLYNLKMHSSLYGVIRLQYWHVGSTYNL